MSWSHLYLRDNRPLPNIAHMLVTSPCSLACTLSQSLRSKRIQKYHSRLLVEH